eukprot:5076410-Amphidinium_carterae.1
MNNVLNDIRNKMSTTIAKNNTFNGACSNLSGTVQLENITLRDHKIIMFRTCVLKNEGFKLHLSGKVLQVFRIVAAAAFFTALAIFRIVSFRVIVGR